MQPVGALDPLSDGKVQGWAWDPAQPDKRLRVIVLLDGEIAGCAHADLPRDDLAGRRIGNGTARHGFVCEVPRAKLRDAELMTLLAEREDGVAFITERSLRMRAALADQDRNPAVHFDITDFLLFIDHHRTVSGIQRVQCGILANTLVSDALLAVRICTQIPGQGRYVEISAASILDILDAIETRQAMPALAWKRNIQTLAQGTGAEPDFQSGDILLTLGASWVCPDYYHGVARAKRRHGLFYVQLCHDLIPTLLPEGQTQGLICAFNRAIAGMLDCADHILVNSRHTERDVLQTCVALAVPCPPTSVIPLGATLDYRQDLRFPEPPTEDGRPQPREVFGDYVLCVGTIEQRKNHAYLYTIWKRMLAERGKAVPILVCVGRIGNDMEDFERHMKVSANLDGHFVQLSGISDDMLKRLYRDCMFTVFPSLYEGWGLPVGESLLFGKLCVSSNATSMPEVGGDWVTYVDPRNVQEGYSAITGLLDDRTRIVACEQALRDRYRPTTWRDASDALMDSLADIHARLQGSVLPLLPPLVLGRLYEFAAPLPTGGSVQRLGSEIALRTATRLLAGTDWHDPEAWGCWSSGPVARFGFSLPTCASGMVLYAMLRLPEYATDQPCQVRLNGLVHGTLTLEAARDHEIMLAIPPKAGPDALIEFWLERLIMPQPGMIDQRLLGIGIRTLYLCQAADLDARLAYFEDRVLLPGVLPLLP